MSDLLVAGSPAPPAGRALHECAALRTRRGQPADGIASTGFGLGTIGGHAAIVSHCMSDPRPKGVARTRGGSVACEQTLPHLAPKHFADQRPRQILDCDDAARNLVSGQVLAAVVTERLDVQLRSLAKDHRSRDVLATARSEEHTSDL